MTELFLSPPVAFPMSQQGEALGSYATHQNWRRYLYVTVFFAFLFCALILPILSSFRRPSKVKALHFFDGKIYTENSVKSSRLKYSAQ